MMKSLSLNDQQVKNLGMWGSFVLVGIIGSIDYMTGYELAFSPFYLLPIFIITWLAGRRLGMLAAVVSALAWFMADFFSLHIYSNPSYYITNTILRLFNFMVVATLADRLKQEIEKQKELARIDSTTGLPNARSFLEFIEAEVARASRYNKPITVMYVDLDNFKEINDQYGHQAGNLALRNAARVLRDALRIVDFVARIGGDEFAAVLPETGVDRAPLICERILAQLSAEMAHQEWPVTFSMGVVTAEHAAGVSPDRLLHQADQLMYQVKKNGKNNFRYSVYTREGE